jgi:hypothetical protein
LYQFIQNKTISATAFNSRVRPASNISTASAITANNQTHSPDGENDTNNTYPHNYNNYETKYNNNNTNYANYSELKKTADQYEIANSKRKPFDEYQSNSNNQINNSSANTNQYGGVAAYTGCFKTIIIFHKIISII